MGEGGRSLPFNQFLLMVTADYFSLSDVFSAAYTLANEAGGVVLLIVGLALGVVIAGAILNAIRETL